MPNIEDVTERAAAAPPPAVRIVNLQQLQDLCGADVLCTFELDGHRVELPVQRMTCAVEEKVRAIRRLAQPKWNPVIKDYDYTGPEYLQKRDENDKVARSLVIYYGCAAIASGKPALVKPEEIHAYVSGLLPETVLEVIASTIQIGGVSLVERANFTSTPGSAN